MKHIIYKITNLVNNKIYVGAHSTEDINDSYMGSGIVVKKAQKKYGMNNIL
ncbi:homing endonuclease [Klebsiella phage CPRSB]|nr:homing endonuclease [Klebsiella phage CPRSB]